MLMQLQEHPELLAALSPLSFEQLITEILGSFGWEVQLTGEESDDGHRFIAVAAVSPGLRATWLLECKVVPSSRPVGVKEIRDLYRDKLEEGASSALMVTTGAFTQGAKDFAQSKRDLQLVDCHRVVAWLKEFKRQAPPTIDELIKILHRSVGHELTEHQLQTIVLELTPLLVNAELASFQNGERGQALTLQEVTLACVRLAAILPLTEGVKLAVWRICSRLLPAELALTPSELDELGEIAANDDVGAPDRTLDWLRKRVTNSGRVLSRVSGNKIMDRVNE